MFYPEISQEKSPAGSTGRRRILFQRDAHIKALFLGQMGSIDCIQSW